MRRLQFLKLIFSTHRIIVLIFLLAFITVFIAPASLSDSLDEWEALRVLSVVYGALLLYLAVYAVISLSILYRHALNFPRITRKICGLLSIITALELLIIVLPQNAPFITIGLVLLVEFLQPFIVLGIFALAYTPNIFLHRYFISRARKKIAQHPNLIVIGITGSYGKTSTKEYLAHILSKKYKVLKTPGHVNVDTGVAKVILRDLKPEHEVFIVEMGAYKRGEIKKICDLVKPKYAVMTGLSDQHLELFGSLEAIAEAKFELAGSVGDAAHIAANADSEALVAEFNRRTISPIWFGTSPRGVQRPHDLQYVPQHVEFSISGHKFVAPITGSAALNNLLGAIAVARMLGMDYADVATAITDMLNVPHTMESKVGRSGALIIDDTYNANTEGVIVGLHDLRLFPYQRKIFVFKEVIELGERTLDDHSRIANAIVRSTDYVLLLPSRMHEHMRSALLKEGYNAEHILTEHDTEKLRKLLDVQTVILFEGRGGESIMMQCL